MIPVSTCPSTPVGTLRNTLHTSLQSSASSSRRGWMQSAGGLERLLWSSPRHWRIFLVGCWRGGPQGGDWADLTDASRSPEAAQWGNCQDVWASKEPPVRWFTVPMGVRLPWDAQAWLVGWSKWSSNRREASTHVDVLPRLSWATSAHGLHCWSCQKAAFLHSATEIKKVELQSWSWQIKFFLKLAELEFMV